MRQEREIQLLDKLLRPDTCRPGDHGPFSRRSDYATGDFCYLRRLSLLVGTQFFVRVAGPCVHACATPQTISDSVSEAGEGRREGRARRRRMSEGQGDSERLQASAFSVCASSGDLGDRRCRFSGPVTCKLHRCITWRCESLYSKLGIQARRSQTKSFPYFPLSYMQLDTRQNLSQWPWRCTSRA